MCYEICILGLRFGFEILSLVVTILCVFVGVLFLVCVQLCWLYVKCGVVGFGVVLLFMHL